MDICSICHEQFDASSVIVIAKHVTDKTIDLSRKRAHYFHRSCIETWKKHCSVKYDTEDLNFSFICPLDRDKISRLYTISAADIVKFDLKYYDSDLLKVIKECKTNKHLIQNIVHIDEFDIRNKTLAYYACYIGDYNVVSKLITKSANFHIPTGLSGFTPFMAAVCQNHYNIVLKLLSSKGIRNGIHTADNKGLTAFSYACKFCHNNIITAFLNDKIPTVHQVRYCLAVYRNDFDNDPLYGKEIIQKLTHYLKPL